MSDEAKKLIRRALDSYQTDKTLRKFAEQKLKEM